MERSAHAPVQRRHVERARLLLEEELLEVPDVLVGAVEVVDEVAFGPALEQRVFRRRDVEIDARAVVVVAERVAVERRPGDRVLAGRHVRSRRHAELVEELHAQLAVRIAAVRGLGFGEPVDQIRAGEIVGRFPAERVQEAGVDPLRVDHLLQQRQDVVAKRRGPRLRGRGRKKPAGERVVEHVVQRLRRHDVGAVIRRRGDDPGRIRNVRRIAERHRRAHRSVGGIVVPPVVVRERDGLRAGLEARAHAAAAQEQQPSRLVGAQLAEIHVRADELSRVERHRRAVRSRDRARSGIDHELGAIGSGERRVADLGLLVVRRRFGDVERDVEVVPRRLLVRDVHRPLDRGVVRGDFAQDASVRVVCVEAEQRGLALELAAGVLVEPERLRRRVRQLRTDEVLVLAVAYARDADGRMDPNRCDRRDVHTHPRAGVRPYTNARADS